MFSKELVEYLLLACEKARGVLDYRDYPSICDLLNDAIDKAEAELRISNHD